MYDIQISGVFAALLTPRTAEGDIDVPALRNLVHFLLNFGISFFAVNGATGEFCLTTPAQLRTILSTVKAASAGKARILCCGICGSITIRRIGQSRRVRTGGGPAVADALLFPL